VTARQPDLFAAARSDVHSRATRLDTPPGSAHRTIEPFDFEPGPECDPDPTYTPPDWLRLPTDQPRPIAEPVARILIRAVLARLQRRLS
jgi:hypothetical protein